MNNDDIERRKRMRGIKILDYKREKRAGWGEGKGISCFLPEKMAFPLAKQILQARWAVWVLAVCGRERECILHFIYEPIYFLLFTVFPLGIRVFGNVAKKSIQVLTGPGLGYLNK